MCESAVLVTVATPPTPKLKVDYTWEVYQNAWAILLYVIIKGNIPEM